MASARVMTTGEIETFKRDGAVVLKDFIPRAQIDKWVDEYWRFMQADPDDPSTWPGKPQFDLGKHFNTQHATNLGGEVTGAGFRPGTLDEDAVRLTDLPSVRAIAEQLGGDNVSAPFPFDGHLIPRFPQLDWQEPAGTHWDGYGPNGWTGGYNHGFGTVAYLSDIPERGGGFTYWPGSHRSSHQFFLENPDMIDGSWRGSQEFMDFWAKEPHASRGGPNSKGKGVQILGKKGDLVIWHGWLQHAGSQRSAEVEPYYPRLALLGSYRNTAMANSGPPVFYEPKETRSSPGSHRGLWEGLFRKPTNRNELRYAIPPLDDLWRFWGEQVKACGGDEQVEAGKLNFETMPRGSAPTREVASKL